MKKWYERCYARLLIFSAMSKLKLAVLLAEWFGNEETQRLLSQDLKLLSFKISKWKKEAAGQETKEDEQ